MASSPCQILLQVWQYKTAVLFLGLLGLMAATLQSEEYAHLHMRPIQWYLYLAATRDTSQKVYNSRWESFTSWCSERDQNPYVTAFLCRHACLRCNSEPGPFHTEMDQRSQAHQRHSSYIAYLVPRVGSDGPHQGPVQTHQDLPSQVPDLENNPPVGYYLRMQPGDAELL